MILICLSPGCPELSSWKGDRFKELVHAFGLVWFVSWQGSTSHNNRKSLTVAQQTNTLCTSAVLLMFQGHPILTHRHATRVMMRWSRSIGGLLPQLPVLNPHCSEVRRQFTAACVSFLPQSSLEPFFLLTAPQSYDQPFWEEVLLLFYIGTVMLGKGQKPRRSSPQPLSIAH